MLASTVTKIFAVFVVGMPLCLVGGLLYSWASGKNVVDGFVAAYGALYKVPGKLCFWVLHATRYMLNAQLFSGTEVKAWQWVNASTLCMHCGRCDSHWGGQRVDSTPHERAVDVRHLHPGCHPGYCHRGRRVHCHRKSLLGQDLAVMVYHVHVINSNPRLLHVKARGPSSVAWQ